MTKRLAFHCAILLILTAPIYAQEENPTLLPIPKDWRFEKINFPLDFAPDLKYNGFEELRFAPGMFDTLSTTYFTYVFAISISDNATFNKGEIELFLTSYYNGLCDAVAESKKLSVNISKIKASVKKIKKRKGEITACNATVNFFDTFTNGKEIVLNMELELFRNQADKKIYLLALVSPFSKDSEVWKNLHKIRRNLKEKSTVFKQ